MGTIRRLAPEEAQKIAAGEVVERPSNAVKELLENALDAGATDIELHIEEGGKSLIRCIDNGCGMSPEDVPLSIEHHATSKISHVEDLDTLHTFGFRGEALSSIASVSTLTLVTKQADAELGTKLVVTGGTVEHCGPQAHTTGTDITIKDLFFNVPARHKFLKSKESEWRSIVNLFQAMCLINTNVAFRLVHNGRPIHTIPIAKNFDERITQIFEPAAHHRMLSAQATQERMALGVTLACSPPDYTRFDKSQIFCFVNNRWVKNYKLVHAFIKGYQGMLQPNRYPAGVISITLDQPYVDVNIHPRKEDVQFMHPRLVTDLIEATVKECLTKNQQTLFTPATPAPPTPRAEASPIREPLTLRPQPSVVPQEPSPTHEQQDAFMKAVQPYFDDEKPAPEQNLEIKSELSYRLVGQVKKTYILVELDDELVFIDQHAAHERIIYERLKSQFEDVARVRLLFPQTVQLTTSDIELLEPHLPALKAFGIEAHRASDTEMVITETPLFVKNQSLEDCMKLAVAALHEHTTLDAHALTKLINEKVHALLSCKAAVKAGDTLATEAMKEIITELYSCEGMLTCPHGRPTLWTLPQPDLEKRFKRDYRS